jgi:hypothetical protein
MGKMRNSHKTLVANPVCKGLFERCRHRWEDNIMFNLKGIGCEDVEWIKLAQHRVQW